MKSLEVGATFTATRTFTDDDVARFAEISGDRGRHHVARDERGRLIVHGLLVATVPTQIGGDLSYLARTMTWEFKKPVFTGDLVTCKLIVTRAEKKEGKTLVEFDCVCRNQDGLEVMTGTSRGVVRG